LREGRAYDADQHAVWSDVDGYLDRTNTASETTAYEDAYRARQKKTDRRVQSLTPLPGQVGVAAVRDGRIIALDVFNTHALYVRAWQKVVRGLLAEKYATKTTTRRAASVVKKALGALVSAPSLVRRHLEEAPPFTVPWTGSRSRPSRTARKCFTQQRQQHKTVLVVG
jgi:hypothetical protein